MPSCEIFKRKPHDLNEYWENKIPAVETIAGAFAAIQSAITGPKVVDACPACIEIRQIQMLQSMNPHSIHWRCPSCSVEYPVDPYTPLGPMSFESEFSA